MSNAVSNFQLPIIGHLFEQKQKELKQLSNNLQINDVKEDNRFEATVKRIKQELSLTAVTIGEPKITDQYATTRNVPANFQNMWGGSQDVFNITVSFPFTGSIELLGFTPNNVSIPMGRVYQTYGSTIDVEVTLPKLNKEEAFAAAREDMRTTIAVASANSIQAQRWFTNFEPAIDNTLNLRRKELIDFYS